MYCLAGLCSGWSYRDFIREMRSLCYQVPVWALPDFNSIFNRVSKKKLKVINSRLVHRKTFVKPRESHRKLLVEEGEEE